MSIFSTKQQVQIVLENGMSVLELWDEPPSRLEVAMQGFLAILEFLQESDHEDFLDAIAQDWNTQDWESIDEWMAHLRQEWDSEKEDEDEGN